MKLRDYQAKALDQVKEELLNGHKRIIVHMATGGGKGAIMSALAKMCLDKGGQSLTVMRMRDLVFQTEYNYRKYHGLQSQLIMGKIAPGSTADLFSSAWPYIASIDTLIRRYKQGAVNYLRSVKLVIVDEIQQTTSDEYRAFLDWLDPDGKMIFIGFSATPYRVGRRGHTWWNHSVCPITPIELRDCGHLVPLTAYGPAEQVETSNISIVGGEYNQKELEKAASKQKIIGGVVENYKKYLDGATAIVFAVTVAHSKKIAEEFNAAGISAEHCDADTPKEERGAALARLASGQTKVLTNVGLFTTGIDVPSVKGCIMARPTQSLNLYLQQVGRVLRPAPGKEMAILIDHAGNCRRHGDPYEFRPAEFTNRSKSPATMPSDPYRACPKCFFYVPTSTIRCPACGHELRAEKDVKHGKGQLAEIEFRKMGEIIEWAVTPRWVSPRTRKIYVRMDYVVEGGIKCSEFYETDRIKNDYYLSKKFSGRMKQRELFNRNTRYKLRAEKNGKFWNVARIQKITKPS